MVHLAVDRGGAGFKRTGPGQAAAHAALRAMFDLTRVHSCRLLTPTTAGLSREAWGRFGVLPFLEVHALHGTTAVLKTVLDPPRSVMATECS